jgi:hypothetical protein
LRAHLEAPKWDGSDLNGRRILLYGEQGLGDSIQFARYIPMVAQRGGRIVLACQPELVDLLKQIQPLEECVPNDRVPPPHDVYCALLSLPAVLGTRPETIPASVPYLTPDPVKTEFWRKRLEGETRRKIGLAWAGRPIHPNDRNRSMSLSQLAGLADVPDAAFYSLQKREGSEQAAHAPMPLTDWTSELHDFTDTAALMANLDLIISVDTSVVHLAGALGRPVWVLLPFIPDWRWMFDRTDSVWYPTMRLFRQPALGDWKTPIGKLLEALRQG